MAADTGQHRKVELVPPNPLWAEQFQHESLKWKAFLSSTVVAVHHGGSTAVPGLRAKPVIDLVIEVRALEGVDVCTDTIVAEGYFALGEHGIVGRRFFYRNDGAIRTHNIHIFPTGHSELERMLLFRDYLRTHSETAQEYAQLKDQLALQFPFDVNAYAMAKTDFVERVIALAKGSRY